MVRILTETARRREPLAWRRCGPDDTTMDAKIMRAKSYDELRELQVAKLRAYLKSTVLPFSKHYRGMGIDPDMLRSPDDLCRLPLTAKKNLTGDPRDFILIPDTGVLGKRPGVILKALLRGRAAVKAGFEHEFRPLTMTSTTGRSSDPVPFVYTAHDIGNLRTAGRRMMEVAGANREMRFLNMFPFAPHLAFWLTHYAGTEFGAFMLSTGGGKVMGTEGNLRLFGKLQPDVLVAMPTFAYHVLHEAVTLGVKNDKLRTIVLGGEKVPSGMRTKLAALARECGASHVDVISTYGFTEAKLAWVECPHSHETPSPGFHVHPDLALIEIIDPATGEPVGEGRPGEIVFTPLDARGSVVLRYRTGDMTDGGLVYGPCPCCGRVIPRIIGNISRVSDIREMRIDKLKGTLIDFNRLDHALDDLPGIGAWQIELRKANDDPLDLDEIILHVEKTGTTESDDALRERLGERIAEVAEVHPNIIFFHDNETMRRLQGVGTQLKEQKIIDRRPKPDGGRDPVKP